MQLARPAPIPLDDAERFLSRVVPWDGESFVNIHWRFKGENYARPGWFGRATRTVHEAIGSIRAQLRKPTSLDIYVCMASQRMADVREHNGRSWNAAMRSAPNAVALKSFFIDVDIKQGGYSSTREALSAAHVFCADTGLPLPTACVQTGSGGLHCYWTIQEALSPSDWLPCAHAFANALKVKGLRCDTQCTVDTVRILRVPQTFNHKMDPPGEVKLGPLRDHDYTLDELWGPLEQFKVATLPNHPQLALVPRMPLSEGSDMAAGVEQRPPLEIDLKEVVPHCGFLRKAVVDGGKDYDNALWMYTTLLATFTKNGEHNAHVMASGHHEYTKEETDAMYARKLREREQKGLGWPSCASINAAGSPACPSCPFLRDGKTPLHTALKPKQVNASVHHDLPLGYVSDVEGRIHKRKVAQDGVTSLHLVTPFTMTDVWLQSDPNTLHWDTTTVAMGKRHHQLDLESIHGEGLGKTLMGMALPIQAPQIKDIRELLVAWITHLQNTKGAVVKSQPYGWWPDRGKPSGFTFAGKTYTKDGERLAASGDANIARQFTPIGELQPWVDAARFVTDQGRQDLCALLATAFAGPLMRFTTVPGAIVSGYSRDSGIGKTTVMRIAQSVWGHPKLAMQGLKDTQKSVLFKMGELRNLPIYWDELQNETHTKTFVDVVFHTSEGREASRLNRAIKLQNAGDWETIMVVASNDSVSNAISRSSTHTTAGINRVFEFEIRKVKKSMTTGEAERVLGGIKENYGNVGVQYAKWLGENTESVREESLATLIEIQKEINEETEERVWTAAIATLLLGAKYANALGFTDFDLAALKAFLIIALQEQRSDRLNTAVDMNKDMNISNVLQQFLKAASARHTIHTNRVHTGSGRPSKGAIMVLNDTSRLDGAQVQRGKDDKILRISGAYFDRWLEDHRYRAYAIRKAMSEKFKMREFQGRIGSGTDIAPDWSERVLELDLTAPELQGVVDV